VRGRVCCLCCRFFPLRWVPVCWWVVRGVWTRWCGSRFRLRYPWRRRGVRRLSLRVWWRSFRRWRLVRVRCWWWCRGGLVPLGWCLLRRRRLASVGWVPAPGLRRLWLWVWVCQCWCGLSVRPSSRRRGASVRWAAVGSRWVNSAGGFGPFFVVVNVFSDRGSFDVRCSTNTQ